MYKNWNEINHNNFVSHFRYAIISVMTWNIKQNLYGVGVSFLAMVGACIALYPDIFRNPDYGISQFGAVHITLIPFFLGFGATIFFLLRIVLSLRLADRLLSWIFLWPSICLGGIAITSYPINRFWYELHWVFVIMLTLGVLVAMVGLSVRRGVGRLDYFLIALFLATTVISILPIVHNIPGIRQFIPRELTGFISSFWVLGRAALRGEPRHD